MDIWISDPDPGNRVLLGAAIRHLGHTLVDPDAETAAAMVFEPAAPASLAEAVAARRRRPGLALVCVSRQRPTASVQALGLAAYVMKPFTMEELRAALARLPEAGGSD